jgi:hypothetical protein
MALPNTDYPRQSNRMPHHNASQVGILRAMQSPCSTAKTQWLRATLTERIRRALRSLLKPFSETARNARTWRSAAYRRMLSAGPGELDQASLSTMHGRRWSAAAIERTAQHVCCGTNARLQRPNQALRDRSSSKFERFVRTFSATKRLRASPPSGDSGAMWKMAKAAPS